MPRASIASTSSPPPARRPAGPRPSTTSSPASARCGAGGAAAAASSARRPIGRGACRATACGASDGLALQQRERLERHPAAQRTTQGGAGAQRLAGVDPPTRRPSTRARPTQAASGKPPVSALPRQIRSCCAARRSQAKRRPGAMEAGVDFVENEHRAAPIGQHLQGRAAASPAQIFTAAPSPARPKSRRSLPRAATSCLVAGAAQRRLDRARAAHRERGGTSRSRRVAGRRDRGRVRGR